MSKQDDFDKLVKEVSDVVGSCGAPRSVQDEHTKDIASLKTTVATSIPEIKKSIDKLENKLADGLDEVKDTLSDLKNELTIITTQRSFVGYLINLGIGFVGILTGLSWDKIASWIGKGHGG